MKIIWVNSDSCVIERIQITPTEVVVSVGNDNLVLTKVQKMSEEPLQIEIIDKEEVILIDVDECSIDKWENQHLDFKDKDLHFIYYDLNNDLYCIRSDFPKKLYAYRVCSLAKVLVSNNKIYGVRFKNYKNAKESPNIFM